MATAGVARTIVATGFWWVATSLAPLSVRPEPLIDLVKDSDLIVLAKVDVLKPENPPRADWKAKDALDAGWILKHGQRAHAIVAEVWKGENTKDLEFLADKTWTCDIADAEAGEAVVLFLSKPGEESPRQIMFAGRGRMPIRKIDKKDYATIWDDVILPKGTTLVPGPEPKYTFIRSIEVTLLKSLVADALKTLEESTKKKDGH